MAARLAKLALGTPAGLVPDMAGPKVYGMDELVRAYLRVHLKRRPMVPVRVPGRAARAARDGGVLALGPAAGQRTWEVYLADRVGPRPTADGSGRPEPLVGESRR